MGCHVYTPSQAEFFKEAKKVLGMPLPRPETTVPCCDMMRKGNAVLFCHLRDHAWTVFVATLGLTHTMLYQSLAGDYGSKLFGTAADGKKLAQLFTLTNAVVGGFVAPTSIAFIDICGLSFLITVLFSCHFGVFESIALPSWMAQLGTCICIVTFTALLLTFILKYLLAYSPPNRIGVVQGLLFAYATTWNLPIVISFQLWMQSRPEGPGRFTLPFTVAAALSTVSFGVYSLRFCAIGLPDLPVLLPEDERELAKPFGCTDLDEVCYVVHLTDRKKLIKMLGSTDPAVISNLVTSIDPDRMAAKMGERDIDELAEMIAEGPMGEESDSEVYECESSTRAPTYEGQVELGLTEAKGQAYRGHGNELVGLLHPKEEPITACDDKDREHQEARHDCGAAQPSVLDSYEDPEAQQLPSCSKSEARVRSESFVKLIRDDDKNGIKNHIMTASVDEIWESFLDIEDWLGEREAMDLEQKFDKLIPAKELAALLRQRPELKKLVTQMTKRKLKQMITRRRKKG